MIVIAHRGNNKEVLENSLSAFRKAVECGAQRIELDVQLSRDGRAFVIHDDFTRRVCAVDAQISHLDAVDIQKIKLNNGEAIPSIETVLDEILPLIELNIEIKESNIPLTKVVAKLIAQHPLREKVIFSCFKYEPLAYLRDHYPDLKRACLVGEGQFPWPFFAHLAPNVFLNEIQTNILHPRVDMIDRNMMDQAKARGWVVYGWAPMRGEESNREGIWSVLKTLEVDGLCTNYPRELKNWLKDVEFDEKRLT